MKQTSPILWIAGWAGAVVGVSLAAIGVLSSSGVASLAGGYGLMTLGAAIYLMAGLKLRETLARRTQLREQPKSTSTASTRPVTQA